MATQGQKDECLLREMLNEILHENSYYTTKYELKCLRVVFWLCSIMRCLHRVVVYYQNCAYARIVPKLFIAFAFPLIPTVFFVCFVCFFNV